VQSIGLLALGSMGALGVLVGVRLLLLARQTRQLPELSMGTGLLCVAVLGIPVCAAGRTPGLVATPLGDAIFGAGLAIALFGIGLLYVFTWRVFRPLAGWARALVVLVFASLGVAWIGLMVASSRGATLAEILPRTRPWGIAMVAQTAGAFAWTGIESLVYRARLQRRLALGLADPVLVNRFLLWGASALAAVALCAVVVASMLLGRAPLGDPMARIAMGAASAVVSLSWYLAFLPPERYVRRIRERAGVPAAP